MCGSAGLVVCGQNCTFIVSSSGAVTACGEGSYGRLSLGNSEDVYTPTLISALQGYPARIVLDGTIHVMLNVFLPDSL